MDWFNFLIYGVAVLLLGFLGSLVHTLWEHWLAQKKENQKLAEKFSSRKEGG